MSPTSAPKPAPRIKRLTLKIKLQKLSKKGFTLFGIWLMSVLIITGTSVASYYLFRSINFYIDYDEICKGGNNDRKH